MLYVDKLCLCVCESQIKSLCTDVHACVCVWEVLIYHFGGSASNAGGKVDEG